MPIISSSLLRGPGSWLPPVIPNDEGGKKRLKNSYDKLKSKKQTSKGHHAFYTDSDEYTCLALDSTLEFLPGHLRTLVNPHLQNNSSVTPHYKVTKLGKEVKRSQGETKNQWLPTAVLSGPVPESWSNDTPGMSQLRGPVRVPRGHDVDERSRTARKNLANLLDLAIPRDPQSASPSADPCLYQRIQVDASNDIHLEHTSAEGSQRDVANGHDIVVAMRYMISVGLPGEDLTKARLSELSRLYESDLADISSFGRDGAPGCAMVTNVRACGSTVQVEVFTWHASIFELDNEEPEEFQAIQSEPGSPGSQTQPDTPGVSGNGACRGSLLKMRMRKSIVEASSPKINFGKEMSSSSSSSTLSSRQPKQRSSVFGALEDMVDESTSDTGMIWSPPTSPKVHKGLKSRDGWQVLGSLTSHIANKTVNSCNPSSLMSRANIEVPAPLETNVREVPASVPELQETQYQIVVPGSVYRTEGLSDSPGQDGPLMLLEGSSYAFYYNVCSKDTEQIQRQFNTRQPLGYRAAVALVPSYVTVTSWDSLSVKALALYFLDPTQPSGRTFITVPEGSITSYSNSTAGHTFDCILELRLYVAEEEDVTSLIANGNCIQVGPHVSCKIFRPPLPTEMLGAINQLLSDSRDWKSKETFDTVTDLILGDAPEATWQGTRSYAALLSKIGEKTIQPSEVTIVPTAVFPQLKQLLFAKRDPHSKASPKRITSPNLDNATLIPPICEAPVIANADSYNSVSLNTPVQVSWKTPADSIVVTRYRICTCQASHATIYYTSNGPQTIVSLHGLPAGMYQVFVQAGSCAGYGAWSPPVAFKLYGRTDVDECMSTLRGLAEEIGHGWVDMQRIAKPVTKLWSIVGCPQKIKMTKEATTAVRDTTTEWFKMAAQTMDEDKILRSLKYARRSDCPWQDLLNIPALLRARKTLLVESITDHPKFLKHVQDLVVEQAQKQTQPSLLQLNLYYSRLAGWDPEETDVRKKSADVMGLEVECGAVQKELVDRHNGEQADKRMFQIMSGSAKEKPELLELPVDDPQYAKIVADLRNGGLPMSQIARIEELEYSDCPDSLDYYMKIRGRTEAEHGSVTLEKELWVGTGMVAPVEAILQGGWGSLMQKCQRYEQLGRALYGATRPAHADLRAYVQPSLGLRQLVLCKTVVGSSLRLEDFRRTWWGKDKTEQEHEEMSYRFKGPPVGYSVVSSQCSLSCDCFWSPPEAQGHNHEDHEHGQRSEIFAFHQLSAGLPLYVVTYADETASSRPLTNVHDGAVRTALKSSMASLRMAEINALCNYGLDLMALDRESLLERLKDIKESVDLDDMEVDLLEADWSLWRDVTVEMQEGDRKRLEEAIDSARNCVNRFEVIMIDHCEDAQRTLDQWSRIEKDLEKVLAAGVEEDVQTVLEDAKKVNFSKRRIQESQSIVQKWRDLDETLERNDINEIAKAIKEAKESSISNTVIRKAEQRAKALSDLESMMQKADKAGNSRLLEVAVKGAMVYGVKGKLLDKARKTISAAKKEK